MKKRNLFLCLAICYISNTYAQDNYFVCQGVACDSETKNPLQDVRIYYCDTIPVYNDPDGKFRVRAKIGEKLHFRKSGYAWHTEEITGKDDWKIILTPSKPDLLRKDLDKDCSPEYTDVIYDGKLVPYEEWTDACDTDHSEIISFRILKGKFDKKQTNTIVIQKNKAIFESIFQWNQKEN